MPNLATKRRILTLIGRTDAFGTQTFDALMTATPQPPVTTENVDGLFPELRLIEMKTTRKSIQNSSLNGFFFGATEREYDMARALGSHYLFAFIVLSSANEYGQPFAVLLPLDEVERRTRKRRVQYQVNFRSDVARDTEDNWVVLFGDTI